MKKNYIQPQITESVRYSLERPLCVSTSGYAGTWGATNHPFANDAWYNENWGKEPVGISNDYTGIDSQTKGRGGDWGSIW